MAESLTAQERELLAAAILAELDGEGGAYDASEWGRLAAAPNSGTGERSERAVSAELAPALCEQIARLAAAVESAGVTASPSPPGGTALFGATDTARARSGRLPDSAERGAARLYGRAPVSDAAVGGAAGQTEQARSLSDYFSRDSRRYNPGFERY